MRVYRLNGRVFWPLATGGGCWALLGLWQALRGRAGPAWEGALLLLLVVALLACAARRPRPGRPSEGGCGGRGVGAAAGGRRAWLEAFHARHLRPSPHVLGHSKAAVGLAVGELVRAGRGAAAAAGGLALRGDFVPVGSAYEQHQVRPAQAFDVLVPLRLPAGLALRVEPEGAAGALRVAALGKGRAQLLSAALLLRWFRGHVQRCLGAARARLQERARLRLAPAVPGCPPALVVEPHADRVCGHLALTVRLTPALPWGPALYLTPRPGPGAAAAAWTLCAAKAEQRLLAWLRQQGPADACPLKCLRILKGLRQLGGRGLAPPLAAPWRRALASDVLKTALLALLLRGPPRAWAGRFLAERLDDLVLFLDGALRRRRLAHLFLGNAALPEALGLPRRLREAAPVNLLADFDGPTLDWVAAHLRDTWRRAPHLLPVPGGPRDSRAPPL